MLEILLGTCGWSYAEWEDILYPQKQNKLKQYTSIFPTTEINSTFYRLPEQGMVLGWSRYTPPDFLFSAKLPQAITHKKALDTAKGVEADLNHFLETMKPLTNAGKLVCILVQLPPFMKFSAERIESFLSVLPSRPSFAIEFRHNSWLKYEAFKLLEKYQVAYTIVDEPLLPSEIHVTSNLAYIRWHGRASKPWFNYKYSEEELEEWVPKVREVSGKTERVLGYFNNHFHGYAPENCLQMMEMLGIVTQHRTAALRRVSSYRKGKVPTERGLEAWIGPVAETALEKLLTNFADTDTIEKARSIPDSDVSLREDSRRALAAYIGDTSVDIDFERRLITHYCPVWSRSSVEKRFCPHVARLFLSIKPEKARAVLVFINSDLVSWRFEPRLAVEFPT